jgi:hypothetical protein
MLTVTWVLFAIAFVLTLISGITGKVPLWIPLLLVCICGLIVGVPFARG